LVARAETADHDIDVPSTVLSKSAKRRLRRKKLGIAIQAHVEAVQKAQSHIVSIISVDSEAQLSSAPNVGAAHHFIPRALDAVRPPAIVVGCQGGQSGSQPCSPVEKRVIAGASTTASVEPSGPREAPTRQSFGRSRMAPVTRLLGQPVLSAPVLGSPVNVSVPSLATQVDVETVEVGPTSPLHIALPKLCCPGQSAAVAMQVDGAVWPASAASNMPIAALSRAGVAMPPRVESLPGSIASCPPSDRTLPASPQNILASIMHPDAHALRSWLHDGGVPCSPSSSDAARQLINFAPTLYLD